MDMNVKATSPTIVGVLTGVSSALIPQDIEVIPSSTETVLTADEGHYIRSVTVKAIPSQDNQSDEPRGDENIDGN